MKREIVYLTVDDWRKCEEFAEQSVDSSLSHYSRRGQGNREKIIQDILTGKLGEIAASRFLRRIGIPVSKPDFAIYESRNKSWAADLHTDTYNFHCKSQGADSAKKYGQSWILQYGGNGRGHTDALFKHRTKADFLIPMGVSDDFVTIFGVIGVPTIFDSECIKMPKLDWLANSKRAIYLPDIDALSYWERWGKVRRLV